MADGTPSAVKRYYLDCLRQAVDDLALPGEAMIVRYLADLLARYAFRIDVDPNSIAACLVEIEHCWTIDSPTFDPGREVALRRDVAEGALFLTGFVWERVRPLRAHRQFIRLGRNAYRFLAEYHRAAGHRDAIVFGKLARRFLRYSVLLMYLREVYLDVDTGRPLTTAGPG